MAAFSVPGPAIICRWRRSGKLPAPIGIEGGRQYLTGT